MNTHRILIRSLALAVLAFAIVPMLAGCATPQQQLALDTQTYRARETNCQHALSFEFCMRVLAAESARRDEQARAVGAGLANGLAAYGAARYPVYPHPAYLPPAPQRVRVCGLSANSGRYGC